MVATSPSAVVELKTNPSAEDRLTRAATRFVASGVLFYAIFLAPGIVAEADMAPIWWTIVFTVALFGTAIALLVAASRGTLETISRLITVFAIAYFFAEVTWLLTWTGETVANLKTPWISSLPALASLAAAIVWRPWKVFAYLVATRGGESVHQLCRPSGSWTQSVVVGNSVRRDVLLHLHRGMHGGGSDRESARRNRCCRKDSGIVGSGD